MQVYKVRLHMLPFRFKIELLSLILNLILSSFNSSQNLTWKMIAAPVFLLLHFRDLYTPIMNCEGECMEKKRFATDYIFRLSSIVRYFSKPGTLIIEYHENPEN